MIQFKELKTIEDFENLSQNDFIAVEYKKPFKEYSKEYTFNVFQVVEVKKNYKEIICQKKNNIYFNYEMLVKGVSNVKSVALIKQTEPKANIEFNCPNCYTQIDIIVQYPAIDINVCDKCCEPYRYHIDEKEYFEVYTL